MNPPKIFISATSGDLSSARQIAKEALLTINCHPVEQTNFEPDWRSVTDMLCGKISDCQALIYLVGFRYGAEPDPATLPPGTPRRSYTQMEYHLARAMGLRVYTFLLPETYPFDVPAKGETPEQTQLLTAHRSLIQSSPHLYEKPANDLDLRTRIIALREQCLSMEGEQQSIAKEVKTNRHWGLWATVATSLILSCISIWVAIGFHKEDQQTRSLREQADLLREAVVQLEQLTQEKTKAGIRIADLPREAIEKELATHLGVSAVELRLNIEAGKRGQDALTRAHANLLAGNLAGARLAIEEVFNGEKFVLQRVIESHKVDGQAYFQEVKYDASLHSYQKAAALVDKTTHPVEWADLQGWVTLIQLQLARYKEAEPLMREIVRLLEQQLGVDHPDVATGLNNLGQLLQATNRLAEAEPLYRRALKIDESRFGPDHPNVARDLTNLATLLKDVNRLPEAETLMRRALLIDETAVGPNHPNVARDSNNLGTLLFATNQLKEAESLLRRALEIDEASFGPAHPNVARDISNLAQLLHSTNRLVEAEPLMHRALKLDEASYGPDHPRVAIRLNNLANMLQDTNRPLEAEALFRRSLAIDEKVFGEGSARAIAGTINLALLLTEIGRLEDAEKLGLKAARAVAVDKLRGIKSLSESEFSKTRAIYEHILQLRGRSQNEISKSLMELDDWSQAEIKKGGAKP